MNIKPGMASTILDAAQHMAQSRGFNAFSFDDLANEVGIRKASIFHHFRSKSDLCRDLVARYRANFRAALEEIDNAQLNYRLQLERYVAIYRAALHDGGRLCLCTMLAADFTTLPVPAQKEVQAFADDNQAWLVRVLTAGQAAGELRFTCRPAIQAQLFLSAVEGAELLALRYGDVLRFDAVTQGLLQQMTTEAPRPEEQGEAAE